MTRTTALILTAISTIMLALTVTSLTLAAPEGPEPELALTSLTLAAQDEPEPELAQSSFKIVGVVWEDTSCDGIRQDDEPLLPHVRLTLRHAGDNGVIDGTDYDIQQDAPLTGDYAFTRTRAGEPNFISIRSEDKPAGYVPAPFRQGADRTRDNDLTVGLLPGTTLWATPVFVMPLDGSQMTDIDIGLCKLVLDEVVYLPLVRR